MTEETVTTSPASIQDSGLSYEGQPTVRLHIWLENEEGMLFGAGRMLLLEGVARFGSLKRASEHLGMSYRAAWGKIKQSEKALGIKLLEKKGSDRRGYCLTETGLEIVNSYAAWFEKVESSALRHAKNTFPFAGVRSFKQKSD